MRELKFKVYIKSLGWVVPVERICFDVQTVEVDLTNGQEDTAEYDFDEVEIMQYVGIKDMYNKEVWERDILIIHISETDTRTATVYYNEKSATFVLNGEGFICNICDLNYPFEVIGMNELFLNGCCNSDVSSVEPSILKSGGKAIIVASIECDDSLYEI